MKTKNEICSNCGKKKSDHYIRVGGRPSEEPDRCNNVYTTEENDKKFKPQSPDSVSLHSPKKQEPSKTLERDTQSQETGEELADGQAGLRHHKVPDSLRASDDGILEEVREALEEGITRNGVLPLDWAMDRIKPILQKKDAEFLSFLKDLLSLCDEDIELKYLIEKKIAEIENREAGK